MREIEFRGKEQDDKYYFLKSLKENFEKAIIRVDIDLYAYRGIDEKC